MVTDSLPAIALGIDPGDKDVMKAKPRNPRESFFAGGAGLQALIGGSLIGGSLIGLLTLAALYFGLYEHGYSMGSQEIPETVLTYARTMAFVVLAASQLFYSLTMRSPTKSIIQVGLFTNKPLIGALLAGLFLQLIVISVPFLASAFKVHNLSALDWGLVFGFALVPLIVNELIKTWLRQQKPRD